MLYTLYHNTTVNFEFDDCPHLLQKFDEIDDLWLQSRIVNDSDAFGQGSGDQEIFGCHHTGERQLDCGSVQTFRSTEIIASLLLNNLSPHLAKSINMKIEGTRPNAITAWHGNICLSTTMQQRPYRDNRQSIEATYFSRDCGTGDLRCRNSERMIIQTYAGPHIVTES